MTLKQIKITHLTPFWKHRPSWLKACQNTFHCLIGCSIGDFGTIILFQHFSPQTPFIKVMPIAMLMGILSSLSLETMILRLKNHFTWSQSLKTALSMSLISMIAMESAENLCDYILTRGQVPISKPFFWIALGISLVVGFLVPLPYNYYKVRKYGKTCH